MRDKQKKVEGVHLTDALQMVDYVCFESPMGAYLKQQGAEKIWRDEYIVFFLFYH